MVWLPRAAAETPLEYLRRVLHELLHASAFDRMHGRKDREAGKTIHYLDPKNGRLVTRRAVDVELMWGVTLVTRVLFRKRPINKPEDHSCASQSRSLSH